MVFRKVDLPNIQDGYSPFAGFLLFLLLLMVATGARANPVDDLAPGHWYKVPHSKLMQVAPKPPPPGIVGPSAVVSKWSGGAFDTKRHRMIVWGGGHADYSGNEVYVFDVNTLKWQRLTDPSRDVSGDINTGLYPDGRPRSTHSYNSLQYLADIDRLGVFGLASTYRESGHSYKLFTFNFDNLHWSHNRASVPSNASGLDAITAYDPKTGKVWMHGPGHGAVYSYNPRADHWSGALGHGKVAIYATAAIDPQREIMVAVGGGAYTPHSQAYLWHLNDQASQIDLSKRTKGPKEIEGAKAPGFVFDSKIGMFVGWDGGADVYVLDPTNWVWHRISPDSDNSVRPPRADGNGTYGRFRYVPSKDAFILVNAATQDVYFYKLPTNLAAHEHQTDGSNMAQIQKLIANNTSSLPTNPSTSPENNPESLTNFAVISEENDKQQYVPVTFGQVFRPGQVQPGDTLRAKLPGGAYLPLQVDKKNSNKDGSLRYAVLTTILPELDPRTVEKIDLVKEKTASVVKESANAPSISKLLQHGFDAQVDVTWQGRHYKVSAARLLKQGKSRLWLSGPLVKEWVVRGPLKDANGGEQSNLGVDLYIRAYRGLDHVRVGIAMNNDWSYAAAPSNVTYDVAVSVGGAVVYKQSDLTQYANTRWHAVFWWGHSVPKSAIWLNTKYIQSTGAVPQYADLKPSSKALNNLVSEWSPMDRGSLAKYMPATGADPDIGLLPKWSALYLVSGDLRAKRAVMLNGDAGGSYSIHYTNKRTGLPLRIDNYPYVSVVGGGQAAVNPKTGKSEAIPKCGGSCKSPYVANNAHMPSVAYLPYLITGDYYYLQELELWANWVEVWMNPPYRDFSKGLLFPHGQVRGQAWSLRELGYAAYIAPDHDPMKPYFQTIISNNISYLKKKYVDNPEANKLHFVSDWAAVLYNDRRGIAPWQQDFLMSSLNQLRRMGVDEVKPVAKWFAKFTVGRMNAPGYCWISGAIYSLNVREAQNAPFYTTFKQAYDNSVPNQVSTARCNSPEMAHALHLGHVGEMTGYAKSPTGFPANLQPALAAAVDVHEQGAVEAWNLFMGRSVKPDYSDYPNFAIVPSK